MSVEVRDERLESVIDPTATLETLADGFEFTEGPIWHPHEQHLTFSDIHANTMFRWSEQSGVAAYRQPSNMANGNTYDHEGRILTCEHATSRVVREAADGTIEVLASHWEGKELNSPNDIVVKSNGDITLLTRLSVEANHQELIETCNSIFVASTKLTAKAVN